MGIKELFLKSWSSKILKLICTCIDMLLYIIFFDGGDELFEFSIKNSDESIHQL